MDGPDYLNSKTMENKLIENKNLPEHLLKILQKPMVQFLQVGQMEKATELLPTTVEGCLDATPIFMVEKVIDPIKVEAFIAYHIVRVAAMVNVDPRLNLQPAQVKFIAQSLRENFTYESLADINLCLKRGIMGFYGQIFRIDGAVIVSWMQSYLDEKYDALEQRKNKEKHPEAKPADLSKVVAEKAKQYGPGTEYYKEAQRIAEELINVPKKPENNSDENAYQRHKVTNVYPITTPEELQKKLLHLEWIRANFDSNGKPLPSYEKENEWILKQQKK